MILGFSFLLALVVSAALVPLCRTVAVRLGHTALVSSLRPNLPPKGKSGGVAIVVTVFGCAAAVGAIQALPVLIACSAALFVVGLSSDVITLKPSTKLVAVIAVASAFLFFDYRLYWSESETIDSLLTLFWIVGITSAFNLLDNMDGLCGGIAVIAGTACLIAVLPAVPGTPIFLHTQYLAIMLGAIAGFLIYNVHPASVEMGDSASLVIGLNMAAITLEIAPGRGSDLLSILAVPALLLLIPIVDATLVAVSRLRTGAATVSGQEHSSHRLVAMGLSERAAVNLLWLLAALSGAVGILADRNQDISGLLAAMFTIAMALFAVHLARVQVHDNVDPDALPTTVTPLGRDLGYRRRLAEIVLDLLIVSLAYYGAHRLLFTAVEWAENFQYFAQSFPIVLGIQMVALLAVGAYRGMWRYFSLSDGVTFTKAVFIGVVASRVTVLYLAPAPADPQALFVVYGMLLILLLVGSRASFRLISDFINRQRQTGRRLLIYGAADAGATVVRHLMTDPRSSYRVIGFIDDDPGKRNIRVHGYQVIGGYDHLVGMVMAGHVDAVAVTQENSSTEGLARLCASHGVTVYQLGIDWREIHVGDAVVGGLPETFRTTDSRVVPLTGFQRERGRAERGRQVDWPREVVPFSAGDHAPIRVAHIITRLILGGAQENTLYTAIRQHRDPRFDVTLVCGIDEAGEGNMFGEVNRAGLKTVVIPSLLREIRPVTDFRAFVDLYRFLRKGSFAVVHTHSSKAGILGRLAARAAGVPVIVHTIHGVAFHEFQAAWKNQLYIALERLCAPLSTRIISVSQRLSEAAVGLRIGRADQHTTIFSGMDLDVFLSARDRLPLEEAKRRVGIPPDAPVVGKVARMFPLKGHEQFLAAAAKISATMPAVHYLLVGDGPLRGELRAAFAKLGLADRVVMVGRVPPDTVPDYIQAMDVVVHTSLREGIARVLPQAGAVGKPVVTFALDGAPEVVSDGVSGYLVPAVDTNQIAERTIGLLRAPERRREFGEAARAFAAEHFSIERMVDRISDLYLQLLAERRS